MWADRKCKLLEQFFGGQKRCFGGETVDLQNEEGMFVPSRREYDSPRGIATLQSCFHLCFYVNMLRGQRVRELNISQGTSAGDTTCPALSVCAVLLLYFCWYFCSDTMWHYASHRIEKSSWVFAHHSQFFPVTLFVIGHGHRSTLHTSGSFLCGSWKMFRHQRAAE